MVVLMFSAFFVGASFLLRFLFFSLKKKIVLYARQSSGLQGNTKARSAAVH